MLEISIIKSEEAEAALDLVWRVFLEFEAPDYSESGVDEFHKSINDASYLAQLSMRGAYMDNELVGIIATRNEGTHIALFFVDGKYQGQGTGRRLFEAVRTDGMTVNSSPFAIPIYRKLGFTETGKEQVVNGLRFTPMKYKC